MRRTTGLIAALLWIGAVGCDSTPEPDEQSRVTARAASVLTAMEAFDPVVFDTIGWASDSIATERGRLVYQISCEKCHGARGAGDANFVFEGETLSPPSFLREPWPLAEAPMDLRRYIFSGNVAGMPYWGLVGLKYRDIDAVARYLEGPLRSGMGYP